MDSLMPTLSMMSLDALPFKEIVLAFLVAVTTFHVSLDLRQRKALLNPKPPKELEGSFSDPDLYKKTQAYALDKWWLGAAKSAWGLLETTAILLFDAFPWIWGFAGQAVQALLEAVQPWVGLGPEPSALKMELATSVAFMLLFLAYTIVSGIPWALYSTFVVEARHGFNKQTLPLFIKDQIMSLLLVFVIAPPFVVGVTYILIVAGPWMPLQLWGFMLCFSLFFMAVYPTLIQPLFNKSEPLSEGSLRTKIEALAASLRFPLKKLFKIDGSKRSTHSNAYMYGFGSNKRIVLYDTLINQCSEEQVVAVLAHELGHWKLRHTPVNFVLGQALTLAQFTLLAFIRTSPTLFSSFGFPEGVRPALLAILLFQQISSPLDEMLSFLLHVVSRRHEFQADGFAVSLGHGPHLSSALLLMHESSKGTLHYDPAYSAFHLTHPPLVERLRAINKAIAGGQKKLM